MACLLSPLCAALKLVLPLMRVYAVLGLCLDAAIASAAFLSVVMMTGRGGSRGGPTTAYSWFCSRSEPEGSCGRSIISYASLETSYASAFFS